MVKISTPEKYNDGLKKEWVIVALLLVIQKNNQNLTT
jgi:hypothetical protein